MVKEGGELGEELVVDVESLLLDGRVASRSNMQYAIPNINEYGVSVK